MSTPLTGKRKNALRLKAPEVDGSTLTDVASLKTKKGRKHRRATHQRSHGRPSVAYRTGEGEGDNTGDEESPLVEVKQKTEAELAIEVDREEERRQKAHIAAQLNLTLEEYEALDAAFGGQAQGNDHDDHDDQEGDGFMTERYYRIFQQFDADGSSAISPDELRELLLAAGEAMDDAELTSVIRQADTDHDGQIDFEEFVALMRARKRLLRVANTMGFGAGPASDDRLQSKKKKKKDAMTPPLTLAALPPLKNAVAIHSPNKRSHHHHGRYHPHSDESASSSDASTLSALRRELAVSEYGVQTLDLKVREGLQWVQQHCPVTSLRAQIFCHR